MLENKIKHLKHYHMPLEAMSSIVAIGLLGKLFQILVVVTHTKVNSIPKVNNTTVNSPWEFCDRGACGHTLNTLPRSVIHT